MARGTPLYLDTSVVLKAIIERGASPEIERKISQASILMTSRLSLVESSRALFRLRSDAALVEAALADAERDIEALWRRCEIFELSPAICELARQVAPGARLRTLDALHVASFVMARRRIAETELLTVDERLKAAVGEHSP